MEFNSQICTTEEQSDRLIALGLNSVTADMHFYHHTEIDNTKTWEPSVIPYGNVMRAAYMYDESYIKDYIKPAWSLHKLIEMMPTYIDVIGDEWTLNILQGKLIAYTTDEKENFLFAQGAVSLYDSIIAAIEWLIQAGHFNKEYLKE